MYLWARDGKAVRGVLPLVLFRAALGSRSLISLPFLDEGGLCADSETARTALWEAALEAARAAGAGSIELRQRAASGLPLAPFGRKVRVVMELAGDPDVAWKRLEAKVRNQIRKAIRSALTPAWCGVEGLEEFYDVFAQNVRDLGSPVHGRRFFSTILEEFPGTARLLLVREGRRAVAGGVCMVFRDTILVPWASSLRQYREHCPSNLLYWEVIRSACEKGLRWLDFGRSSPGSGTHRFKRQWGGVDHPLHWEIFDRAHPTSREHRSLVNAEDARYRLAVRAWQRLPVPLATAVGPIVRRHLSN
jgi:FemAB-related protein (PEP-CTERM system-associated)